MIPRAVAHINPSALRHNLRQVKKFAPQSKIITMVKANGYGHGLLQAASALSDADAFGVATIDEALALRNSGVLKPIVLMCGFIDGEELHTMAEFNIAAVLHAEYQVRLLETQSLKKPLAIWLKLDSGMHRLGFSPTEIHAIYARLMACGHVQKPFVTMTHFACSDAKDTLHTQQQLTQFQQMVTWAGEQSLACSAAIIAWPETQADWVRPGIMLYGASPLTATIGADFSLQPVMTLASRLIAIKQLSPGESVGYAATYVCPETMPIGIVAIGYGDGYPRHAKNGAPVLINGKICPLIGRVSMDFITVDLRTQPNAHVGDKVTLWGDGLPIEYVAESANTISYELLTKVTQRVEFDYTEKC